jgi:hypothetical protein
MTLNFMTLNVGTGPSWIQNTYATTTEVKVAETKTTEIVSKHTKTINSNRLFNKGFSEPTIQSLIVMSESAYQLFESLQFSNDPHENQTLVVYQNFIFQNVYLEIQSFSQTLKEKALDLIKEIKDKNDLSLNGSSQNGSSRQIQQLEEILNLVEQLKKLSIDPKSNRINSATVFVNSSYFRVTSLFLKKLQSKLKTIEPFQVQYSHLSGDLTLEPIILQSLTLRNLAKFSNLLTNQKSNPPSSFNIQFWRVLIKQILQNASLSLSVSETLLSSIESNSPRAELKSSIKSYSQKLVQYIKTLESLAKKIESQTELNSKQVLLLNQTLESLSDASFAYYQIIDTWLMITLNDCHYNLSK